MPNFLLIADVALILLVHRRQKHLTFNRDLTELHLSHEEIYFV